MKRVCRSHYDESHNVDDEGGEGRLASVKSRRLMLFEMALLSIVPPLLTSPSAAASWFEKNNDTYGSIPDDILSGLVYRRILGKGTYKTVYLVSTNDDDSQYAMAVERLRFKRDVKDACRGIRIVESLRRRLPNDEWTSFERIWGWWLQSHPPRDFAVGHCVFDDLPKDRTRIEPNSFRGSKWLVAFKTVYRGDLKSMAREGGGEASMMTTWRLGDGDDGALTLVYRLCRSGRIMHERGLIHRDIKPKNIMIDDGGHPVIIDFEFAEFVNGGDIDDGGMMCIVQPGVVKGDVNYVLAEDVARYRGCRRGDAYAMGKCQS